MVDGYNAGVASASTEGRFGSAQRRVGAVMVNSGSMIDDDTVG